MSAESKPLSLRDHLHRCKVVHNAEVINPNAARGCRDEGNKLVDKMSGFDQDRYLAILGTPHQMGETKEVMREWLRRHSAAVEALLTG